MLTIKKHWKWRKEYTSLLDILNLRLPKKQIYFEMLTVFQLVNRKFSAVLTGVHHYLLS